MVRQRKIPWFAGMGIKIKDTIAMEQYGNNNMKATCLVVVVSNQSQLLTIWCMLEVAVVNSCFRVEIT